jgi:peroxiredoxin
MKSLHSFIPIAMLFAFNQCTSAQQTRTAEEAEGMAVGQVVPSFKAADQNGEIFSLEEALAEGPVVLIFYRGQWCPVCNRHLSNIQDSLDLIAEAGGRVIAVSPEKPELLGKTAKKTGAEFTLLYDEGYQIGNAFDVTFTPSGKERLLYNTVLGADLKDAHSDDSEQLPIPATYIIGQDGRVAWRQFDPNYKLRSSAAEIVQKLNEL